MPTDRSRNSAARLAALALAVSVATAGCDNDDDTMAPPPGGGSGALRVITVTTGDTLDPDGYSITVDADLEGNAEPNDTLVFSGLAAGSHGVAATDVAVNCGIGAAANPRVLQVSAGDTTTTVFSLACRPALFERILYETSRLDGTVDILAVRPDGSDPIELTSAGDRARPALSPDGTRLAFVRVGTTPADDEIFLMGADGAGLDNLTQNTAADDNPDWSPDGTRIVFDSDRDGNRELYIVEDDGANPIRLTEDPADDSFAAWSPGGNLIAFVRQPDDLATREILVIEVDGTGPVGLTTNSLLDAHPEWSPDGDRIVFERDGDLFLMDPDGANELPLTATPGATETTPRFSPDGARIVFASDEDGDFDLYIMNADGSDVQRLTDEPGDELFPVWAPGDAAR
jgi:Tol biopolymer transport system component